VCVCVCVCVCEHNGIKIKYEEIINEVAMLTKHVYIPNLRRLRGVKQFTFKYRHRYPD